MEGLGIYLTDYDLFSAPPGTVGDSRDDSFMDH